VQSFPTLGPSADYEIGITSDWLNQRLRLNASAFYPIVAYQR
jgi:outer membrane receptor for ferric coprogen and ferric-rhodotorulic acid